jgi:Transposase DDE domain group 1
MIVQGGWQEVFSLEGCERIVLEPSTAHLTSDAGLLPLRALDERLGLTAAFAAALNDPRDPELVEHSVAEMVRQRIYGILADYEDQDDHDTLRTDPIFKLIVGRSPDGPALASQPTLSRFENFIDIPSLKRLRELFVAQFIASFPTPPRHLVFDLDAVDDPAHGKQQLTFWHNYYDQNQYLPLIVTCANNDLVVMVSLRHGSAHAALGADDDLDFLFCRLRTAWPNVRLYVRGDAAFGIPRMYDVCQRWDAFYTFGLNANQVLQRWTALLLATAVDLWAKELEAAREEGRPAVPVRLFEGFWYKAEDWGAQRWVVAKAEANAEGTNLRFVISNRPGAWFSAAATYDEYVQRGESENRNKEIKLGCAMGRLSDHRFVANYFRLYLAAAVLNLLIRFRQAVRQPEASSAAAAAVARAGAAEAAAAQAATAATAPTQAAAARAGDPSAGRARAGRARAGRGLCGGAKAALLPVAAPGRRLGRGPARYLAPVGNQGRGRGGGERPPRVGPPLGLLAPPGRVPKDVPTLA